jgi:glutaredoxin
MRKNFLGIILFFLSFFVFSFADAQIILDDEKLDLDLFYSSTCPHCGNAREFLEDFSLKSSEIDIEEYVLDDQENVQLLEEYYGEYGVPEDYHGLVPIIFVEDGYILGFNDSTKERLNEIASAFLGGEDIGGGEAYDSYSKLEDLESVNIPLIGEVNFKNMPPWILSAAFGVLDGFNACAMAALAILLAMLIGLGSRKKLILIGGIFIFISGLVYYGFMAAWLNLFIVLDGLQFLTIITGVITIVFAVIILREYFSGVICKLCEIDPGKQGWFAKKEMVLMEKMQKLVSKETPLFVMIFGVIVIAAGINLIELVCSFGLPVAFTKLLTVYNLSSFEYYFYLFIYILFYMLDDFIIFLIAVFTFNLAQESDRFIKAAKFISGILLLILGIIMIFFPDVLGFI